MLLYGHSQAVADWVTAQVPYVSSFGDCQAIGVLSKEGALIAGVVYSDYQPDYGTIQLSIAAISPMWARRENISGLLAYPFDQLGIFKAWTSARADNAKAIRSTQHIGFRREAILAHHYGKGLHAHVFRMLEPDYRRLYGG